MTFTSPLALYKHQVARFAAVQRTAKEMHREIAEAGYRDGVELTSGGNGPQGSARTPWLRKNRPFARNMARVRTRVRPLPIGYISGEVKGSFNLAVIRSGSGQIIDLRNRAPHARFILRDGGTVKMRGRGFQAEIQKRWRARNKALIDTVRKRQAS